VTGTRANFGVGVPILLFFFVGGIVFWFVMPDIYIGQIWVGVSVLLGLIFGGLYVKQRGEQRVAAEGIQGTAQILGMSQTGMYINEQPQVELHMRIEAPGIAPYELHKKVIVPLIALGSLSGGRLTVAIDREDHENVVVNWSQTAAPMVISTQLESSGHDVDAAPAAPTATKADPVQRLEELRELKEKGLISEAEYESKRIQIISEF
jgi:hypothetical protein